LKLLPVLVLAVVLAAAVPMTARADITTELIAWYPFDGNMQDASGNANHGSPVGGLVLTSDRFGTPNMAYEFNGTNSYVYIPNSSSLSSPDTALTQAAWVLFYGASQVGQAFGPITMKSAGTANSFMYRMLATPAAGTSVAFNDWYNAYGISYPFELDQWYHIASVFNGSMVKFYVNGAAVDSVAAPTTILPDGNDLTIGGDTPGILEIFYGKIDDVRLYSRALSDADIAELCDCATTGVGTASLPPASLIRRTYPNPTGGDTRIDFVLGTGGEVELSVYDVAGRLVRTLRLGVLAQGDHTAGWDGRDGSGSFVPSGVYFVRLKAGDLVTSTRVIKLR